MKKLVLILLALTLVFSMLVFSACKSSNPKDDKPADNTGDNTNNTPSDNTGDNTNTGNEDNEPEAWVNPYAGQTSQGELAIGVYEASRVYTTEYNGSPFSMTFEIRFTFFPDNSFTLTNFSGVEKGKGTYSLADGVYTLVFENEKTSSFIVTSDNKVALLQDLPYGSAGVDLDAVEGIVAEYKDVKGAISNAEYVTVFEKTTGMGKITYTHKVVVTGNIISTSVTYTTPMDGEDGPNVGNSYTGTYAVEDGVLTVTCNDGTALTGTFTDATHFTLNIKASAMASAADEITFALPIAEGSYIYVLEKTTGMGKITYTHKAVVSGNTITTSVTYTTPMDGEDGPNVGNSYTGKYTVVDGVLTVTLADGSTLTGTFTDATHFTLAIKASAMASAADTVVFAPAIADGEYVYVLEKVAGMMGTITYTHKAVVSGNTITTSVTYKTPMDESDEPNVGNTFTGTYTIADGVLTVTLADETVLTGTFTDSTHFTLTIKASAMASTADEVVFAPAK